MRCFLIVVVLASLVLGSGGFAVPEPLGEYIGDLISTQQFSNEPIQIVSTPQNTYYLVTNQQSYYSANGKNWEIKNSSLPTATGGLTIDSSGTLYISGSDVYKSVDGGVKWNIVGQTGELGSTPNLKVKIVQGTLYAWHPDQGLYYYNPSLGHWYVVISPTQFKVYDFMYVDGGVYYVGVQNGEVKLFHGLTPKGTIAGTITPSYTTLYRKLLTYYDGAFYVALRKMAGGGAIYKSSDIGQTWEKVHDTSGTPASISSSTVNGIQIITTDKVWRSWSGSVWKEVKPITGGGIDIISTNIDRQTIVAAGYSVYTYDRNTFPILDLTENYTIQKNQDLQLSLSARDLEEDTLTYIWEKIGCGTK